MSEPLDLSPNDDDLTKAVLALVDREIADQVAIIAAERARLAEAEQRLAEAEHRHTTTMGRLYSIKASLKPQTSNLAGWLTYRDYARERNIEEPSAKQAIRRARRKSPIATQTHGGCKVFARSGLVKAGLL